MVTSGLPLSLCSWILSMDDVLKKVNGTSELLAYRDCVIAGQTRVCFYLSLCK
jgi:hypothetical protein